MLRLVVLALAVAACAVAGLAVPGAEGAVSAGQLARMQRIAAAAWPANACTGRVQFDWTTDGFLDALEPGAVAAADPAACQVVASRDRWAGWKAYLCTVLVHEYGHLAGREHVSNSRNVMYGGWLGNAIWPRCRRAFPPPTAHLVLRPRARGTQRSA